MSEYAARYQSLLVGSDGEERARRRIELFVRTLLHRASAVVLIQDLDKRGQRWWSCLSKTWISGGFGGGRAYPRLG